MAYKPLNDWLDKHEGKKEGSSYENIQKERVRQGYKREDVKKNLDKQFGHPMKQLDKIMSNTFGKKKYKTLLGTPTDKPPSKERQYHIDAHKKKIAKKMSAHERSKTIKDAVSQAHGSAHLGRKGAPGLYPEQLTPKEKYYRKEHDVRENVRLDKFHKSGYGQHLEERSRRRGEQDL